MEAARRNFMRSIVHEYVEHKKYGRGRIISEDIGKITVEFISQFEKKLFQFPDAFEQFLKFEDQSLEEECLLLLQSKKQEIEEEQERKLLESKKLNEERKKEESESKKKSNKVTKGVALKLKK
jgi:hypothetical protein